MAGMISPHTILRPRKYTFTILPMRVEFGLRVVQALPVGGGARGIGVEVSIAVCRSTSFVAGSTPLEKSEL